MPDRCVEGRVKRLMRGRQHNQISARREMPRYPLDLGTIIFDMLEHVDIEHAIEALVGTKHRGRATAWLTHRRQSSGLRFRRKAGGHCGIWLNRHPAFDRSTAKIAGDRANAGADLQNVPAQERPHLLLPVATPVYSLGKQLEL